MQASAGLITDWHFYAYAIPAVILFGIAKGGFTGLGVAGTVLMALVIPPLQAVAILLPIILLMDGLSLWIYRGAHDKALLLRMLPFAFAGIGAAALTAGQIDPDTLRIVLGLIVGLFVIQQALGALRRTPAAPPPAWFGGVMGFVAGFTSFLANAGTPPFQVYVLPLRLESRLYVGTKAVFFAVVNVAKLLPFILLGQFTTQNLATSAVLAPLAPVGVLIGAYLVRRLPARVFYAIIYSILAIAAVKLLYDGLSRFDPTDLL